MVQLDARFAQELRSSGVTLTAVYLGSVPVIESMNVMVSEMRSQVVGECIQYVAAAVGECTERDLNPIVSRIIGEVKQENSIVDLNISSKMVKVIKQNRLIQRHPLSFFSFGSQGQRGTETENMFGYIAKNKDGTDRRCHVLSSKDVQKLLDTLVAAIQVNTDDAKAKAQGDTPSTSNSDSIGSADGRRIPNLHRQNLVQSSKMTIISDDVQSKPWYHGAIPRDEAVQLLREAGDFLVRYSDHTAGKFVLSGLTTEGEHKHLILLDERMRVRTRERTFNTITDLINFHMENEMAVRSEGGRAETSLMLKHAVPRSQ